MIQQKTRIQIHEEDDVESIFSIDNEPNDNSLFAIQSLDNEPKESDSDWNSKEVYMFQNQISSPTSIASTIPTPHVPVSIYLGCSVRTTVLGSQLPGKDLVVGFDIYTQARFLRIVPDGLKYKQMFKPFVDIPRFFLMQPTEEIKLLLEELKTKSYAESHEDFLSKCDHSLWKNLEFYVKLPFKKNKDVNPTKASHTGMNLEHQRLAEAECNELLQQGLIEPSDSQWACEAFHVNKRSEQARGKLRLVINYQPLNHFLQDDKFPLPNRNALFSSLAKAHNFSKFDLKAGFWKSAQSKAVKVQPQLLRWAEWFSKYSFDCKHIKGKTNILADLLTRPKQNQAQIMMYRASSSKETVPEKKQKKDLESAFNIPPNLNPKFPPEVYRLVLENKFHPKARDMIF
ncbi:hypothetical protein V6N12_053805 [Hibiscus sabdariffa]|uniref:Polyprotein n=1 Tax=Hibiscus sabdariffa TaxID=183260 RepID=A0ABR2D8N2_9ROSI